MATARAAPLKLGLLAGLAMLAGCTSLDPSPASALTGTTMAALLWNTPYPNLAIEIDHVEGFVPSSHAVAVLVSTLENVTRKDSITLLPIQVLARSDASPLSPKAWSHDELVELAASTLDSAGRGAYGRGDTAVLHVLYLDGHFESTESDAVGLRIDGTVFLFEGYPVTEPSVPHKLPRDYTERAVLVHEAGHVMGLVNSGLPMVRDHEDPSNAHHSANPQSVMYHTVDVFQSQLATVSEGEAPPYTFDADDLADIAAFQALEPKAS